jgi:hypothetical protein
MFVLDAILWDDISRFSDAIVGNATGSDLLVVVWRINCSMEQRQSYGSFIHGGLPLDDNCRR